MRRGDYASAWAVSDAVPARAGPPDDPRLPYHLRYVWDGRAFDGRDVLVRCYHGLGDTLHFIRYLKPMRARAASVTLEVQPELIVLLRAHPGIDRLIPFDVAAPVKPFACDIEIMELFHALRLPPEAVPPPYLTIVSPPRRGAPSIGLRAQAGDWDQDRSVPPALLAAALPPEARPIQLYAATVAETAALIGSVDLVISVDTMTAHLAGAMNHPACVLLKADADWRWGEGNTTPWYPATRLYRQGQPGDWDAPIAALARDTVSAGLDRLLRRRLLRQLHE